jgi:hypothetical protein
MLFTSIGVLLSVSWVVCFLDYTCAGEKNYATRRLIGKSRFTANGVYHALIFGIIPGKPACFLHRRRKFSGLTGCPAGFMDRLL